MCDTALAYKDDLGLVYKHLEEFLDDQDFPDDMKTLLMNWSILRSDANLSEPQEALTHLVPEYIYGQDSEFFHFSCIVGINRKYYNGEVINLHVASNFDTNKIKMN